jgi:hypothetical protein
MGGSHLESKIERLQLGTLNVANVVTPWTSKLGNQFVDLPYGNARLPRAGGGGDSGPPGPDFGNLPARPGRKSRIIGPNRGLIGA